MESKLLNKRKVKFGVFESALASLLFIIYNFLFVQIYMAIFPNGMAENSFGMFVVQFLLEAMFAVTAITVALSKKVDIKQASGVKKRINAKMVLIGFAISLVGIYGFGNLTNVFLEFLSICGYKSVLGTISITTFWQYIGYVIASCVAPAICEELLFRGTILSGLRDFGIKIAVLGSAVIFTFMHGNAEQTIHQFIIGIIVGYLFYKSGNLWLGIIVHFFNNFISVTQSFVVSLFVDESAAVATQTITLSGFIVDIIIAGIMAYVAYVFTKWLIDKMLVENAKLNDKTLVAETTEQPILVDGQEVVTEVVVEGGENVASSDVAESSGNHSQTEKKPLSIATVILFAISGCYMIFEWVSNLLLGLGVM